MTMLPVQVQKLHVDVDVQGINVDFCGNPQVRTYFVYLYATPAFLQHAYLPEPYRYTAVNHSTACILH